MTSKSANPGPGPSQPLPVSSRPGRTAAASGQAPHGSSRPPFHGSSHGPSQSPDPAAAAAALTLAPARVHEAGGPGRRSFALFQAARSSGPVVWILPAHAPETLMLPGLPQGLGERLMILRPGSETDLLWSAEEVLRAKPVALMVAEPGKMLSLTAGRRLQLAAEAGNTVGLMLIGEGQGSNAAETRWFCTPLAAPDKHGPSDDRIRDEGRGDSTLQAWSLNKNKKGTTGNLVLNWNGASSAFHMVSPPRERSCAAGGGSERA